VLALLLAVTSFIERRRFGFYLRAIKASERAARSLGVPVRRTKMQALALSAALALPSLADAKTITAVMHADLRTPGMMTTAYIVRDFGYMIYDTLLAEDSSFKIQPQMAEYKISDDKLTYTFTLRDGLKWHDGTPVTAEDCVASLKRWGKVDGMGQKLMDFTASIDATDAKTITLKLKTADFRQRTRSQSIHAPTQLAAKIFATTREMLAKEIDGTALRLMGAGVSALRPGSPGDDTDMLDRRSAHAERAIDDLRKKFGSTAVIRGIAYEGPEKAE